MSFLAITVAVQLLAASPSQGARPTAAESRVGLSPRYQAMSPAKLRAAVHSTLRREAKAKGPGRVEIVKELVALYQQLGLNQQMVGRQQLQGLIGGRLNRGMKNDDYGPDLVDLIERTIAPGTWESQGGPGRIYYWRNGRALVISQTQQAHEGLADMLEQMHVAGD